MGRIRRRFTYIGLLIAFTLTLGTVGFRWMEGYPLFDAFYMTVITVSTVGYAELHPLSSAGRVFNTFLILFGVTTIFYGIGIMTQTIIELELGAVFDKKRVRRMIEKLENHYIICGFGRVGRNAAAELRRSGAPFVVVDRNPDRAEQAIHEGMLAVIAESTRDETLRDAGVERARGLLAALATDADNLFTILSAKALNPRLYVATRAAEEEAEAKMKRAGADAVFTPYSTAGLRLAQALLRPHVFQFFDLTAKSIGMDVSIEQVGVSADSEFASRSLAQMQIRRDLGVIVLAIRKQSGGMLFNPPAETEICAGDHLIVMGEPANLIKLESALIQGRAARSGPR